MLYRGRSDLVPFGISEQPHHSLIPQISPKRKNQTNHTRAGLGQLSPLPGFDPHLK